MTPLYSGSSYLWQFLSSFVYFSSSAPLAYPLNFNVPQSSFLTMFFFLLSNVDLPGSLPQVSSLDNYEKSRKLHAGEFLKCQWALSILCFAEGQQLLLIRALFFPCKSRKEKRSQRQWWWAPGLEEFTSLLSASQWPRKQRRFDREYFFLIENNKF